MNFDIILLNNASKQVTILSKMENESVNHLYLEFNDVDLDVPSGEYTYVVIPNERDDVKYDVKLPILKSVLHTDDGDILFEDIHPRIGLLKVGLEETANEYVDDTVENNNQFLYYEG